MCQLVDDYADKRANKRVKQEKITSVLKMKDLLDINTICSVMNLSKDIVNNILDFNSDDTTYIYEQMKDVDFKLA